MTLRALVMVCAVMFSSLVTSSRVAASSPDVVLQWNQIAVTTMLTPPAASPFGQARFAAIVQLAVFEAVNAVTHHYQPYLGTITAPAGASADAAAVAAAHTVLKTYFSTNSAATLDAARATSLGAIPDSQAKTDGIATGEAAATAMITPPTNERSYQLS